MSTSSDSSSIRTTTPPSRLETTLIRAPEEVYYYPQEISIKKGFTSEERWDIRTQSPLGSKPDALRKVKPDEAKKKREDKNIEYYKRWGRKRR